MSRPDREATAVAELEFTGDDLVALASKLDQLSDRLSERERALLLATFQMAGDQLNQLGGGGGSGLESTGLGRTASNLPTVRIANVERLPSLSEGFANSFTPGNVAGNISGLRAVEWDASVGVMGGMG